MTKEELMSNWDNMFPNFDVAEIFCQGTRCGCKHELWNEDRYGEDVPEYFLEAMQLLQRIRNDWARPLPINSAHRCENHNRMVGGARNSQHLKIAFDIAMPQLLQQEFTDLAEEYGFHGIGHYPKKGFVHIDRRDGIAFWIG